MHTPHAVFLSDAHLAFPEDANYRRVAQFLDRLSGLPDLFILGDFFAFWMGFSSVPARYQPIVERLQRLTRGGTRLHYLEGNHDIDMAPYFARRLGAAVYPEQAEVTVGSRRLYLAHGDLVDETDGGYRFLRGALRSLPLRVASRTVHPETVLRIARPFAEDKHYTEDYASHLPPRFAEFSRARWAEGFDGVVLGHCHHPEMLEETVGGRPCFYANLGDWIRHFTWLGCENGHFTLHREPA
ncbi:MAG: UDP-2,3-diacylglucosamine diphosphatase [Nitrospirota bacterium]|nr:UDP-2,3-diacylglucosamine diphosphatase [Nitrospirota bacterium]